MQRFRQNPLASSGHRFRNLQRNSSTIDSTEDIKAPLNSLLGLVYRRLLIKCYKPEDESPLESSDVF